MYSQLHDITLQNGCIEADILLSEVYVLADNSLPDDMRLVAPGFVRNVMRYSDKIKVANEYR